MVPRERAAGQAALLFVGRYVTPTVSLRRVRLVHASHLTETSRFALRVFAQKWAGDNRHSPVRDEMFIAPAELKKRPAPLGAKC